MFQSLTRSGRVRQLLGRGSSCAKRSVKLSQDLRKGTSSAANYPGNNGDAQKTKQPQKPPPEIPSQEECCGSGCSDCIFLRYAEELVDYYKDGGAIALKELEKIPDTSVRVFVQTEIKFYLAHDKEMRDRIKRSRQGPSTVTGQPQD